MKDEASMLDDDHDPLFSILDDLEPDDRDRDLRARILAAGLGQMTRRRRQRLAATIATFIAVAALSFAAGRLSKARPETPSSRVEEEAPPGGPAIESADDLERMATRAPLAERAGIWRRAGDARLREGADVLRAMDCYRRALALDPKTVTVALEEREASWLLLAMAENKD